MVPDATRRDLRAITLDGIFFSAMVGLGEAYVPAFALAVGLGEVTAGLLATLPMLAGACFQMVTPLALRMLRSYRRWVVLCACLQAASFTPLVVGALRGRIDLVWLAAAVVAYWSFGMATSPAWNAWVTSLVPLRVRTRFFARRTRAAHAALFAAIALGGVALQWGERHGMALGLFAALFAGAAVARFASAHFLASQREVPGQAERHQALGVGEVVGAIRHARSGRVLVYLLGMQAAVNVSAPYFTPYMLEELSLGYGRFVALTAAAFLSRVLVLPALGRLAHARGARSLLYLGAVGVVPIPVLWLFSDAFGYLLFLQLLSGAVWAALELATLLSFFEGIEEHERASVLSAFNLANALAIAGGALAGGWLFALLDGGMLGYAALFAISTLGRFGMLFVVGGVEPAATMIEMRLRTLAVRPSADSVDRPILATLPGAGAAAQGEPE